MEPLREHSRHNVNQDALVIGGGVSGMVSALELAKQGIKVHLVEKEKELGGNLRKLHYLHPGTVTSISRGSSRRSERTRTSRCASGLTSRASTDM